MARLSMGNHICWSLLCMQPITCAYCCTCHDTEILKQLML